MFSEPYFDSGGYSPYSRYGMGDDLSNTPYFRPLPNAPAVRANMTKWNQHVAQAHYHGLSKTLSQYMAQSPD